MSDAPPPATPDAPPADAPADESDKDWKAEHEKAIAEARKWEARAKADHEKVKELDKLQRASMTDLEKAVADAREEGRATAIREATTELVDARMEAAASGRLSEKQLAVLLDGYDRTKFLTDDGKVDAAKVAKFIEAIAPAKGTPDLGQGPRGEAGPGDFNSRIRERMRR